MVHIYMYFVSFKYEITVQYTYLKNYLLIEIILIDV